MKKILLFTLQLFFICQVANAQNFIATYYVDYNSSISFGVTTTGPVAYTWQTLAPAPYASGSGTFEGPNVIITGLPNTTFIQFSMEPQNLKRYQSAGTYVGIYAFYLTDISQWGAVEWTSMENAFRYSAFLQITAADVPNLSNVTSMANMFEWCPPFNSAYNINSWDVSNVTNMSKMFKDCWNFNQALSLWNTSNVTNMSGMFETAKEFNLNIGLWNTSNVTNMSRMFASAYAFNKNIGNWNTSNVTDMSDMFGYTANMNPGLIFNQNIGSWDTSSVTNMSGMFKGTYAFNQNIGNWDVSNVTNMSRMFQNTFAFNQNIGGWDTSNVTDMFAMFNSAIPPFGQPYAFANGGSDSMKNWNTANVENMAFMFYNASSFNLSLGDWALNQEVFLYNMLDYSGLSCENYSKTLIDWNNNPNTPSNKTLGAAALEFGSEAQSAVNNLTFNKFWGFAGHDISYFAGIFSLPTVYCEGDQIPQLPTTSDNGIVGSWSPALNPLATTSYTFLPNPGQCASTTNFTITVNSSAEPVADATQSFAPNSNIGNIAISPANVRWFSTSQDALAGQNQLPSSTVLLDNTTYYAVNGAGQCTSAPFAVTVMISLGVESINQQFLKFYPNPVTSILNISYNNPIESVKIYNLLGQILLADTPNSADVAVDMSILPNGIYLVKIKSDSETGDFKVVKR